MSSLPTTFRSRNPIPNTPYASAAALLLAATSVARYCRAGGPVSLIIAILSIIVGTYMLAAYLRRKKPVVSVSDTVIEFGSPFPFRKHGAVPIREILEIQIPPAVVLLQTEAGPVRVSLRELMEPEQYAVFEAIKQRVGSEP